MNGYPGNPALTSEARERLLVTFAQTLDLAAKGSLQEAALGCDFILRMDPLFSPARVLHERVSQASGPVAVEDLRSFSGDETIFVPLAPAGPAEAPTLPPVEELSFAGLDELHFDAPDLSETLGTSPGGDAGIPLAEPDAPAPSVTPAAAVSEGDDRIADLLNEGQSAFARGEYQSAIDAWSRIFLINIDHAEASRRIEEARRLKAEGERKVEELFQEGLAKFEAGAVEDARAAFQQVLAIQPNYLAAREQLQNLEAGKAAKTRMTGAVARPAAAESSPAPAAASLKEEILVPPEPGEERKPAGKREAPAMAAKSGRGRRMFVWVASGVLVILAGGGWWLYSQWDRFFPNSQPAPPTAATATPRPAPAPALDALARATKLHDDGKTATAVAQLRRLAPGDPLYERAQALIRQWQAPAVAAPQLPGATAALTATATERRSQLVAEARKAAAEHRYLAAAGLLDQAAAIAPLEDPVAELSRDMKRRVQPLEHQMQLFKQGEWEYVLRQLWPLHDGDPANRDVTKVMVDCYFDLAVRDLQRDAPAEAAAKLGDGLKLDPQDRDLRRLLLFAQTYKGRPQDLLYRTYVKYVPFR